MRQSSGIKLTDDAKIFLSRAVEVVNNFDKLADDFSANKKIIGGDIYFGLAESYQIRYLAKKIRRLKNNYSDFHYHIISGDTEQVIGKLDSGILDFAVLAETPDFNKYNCWQFPEADNWGLIIPADDELAQLENIQFENLIGLPLFCSGQAWSKEIAKWCGGRIDKLQLEMSLKLSYNGAIFVKEKLGYLLTLDKLINFSDLVFKPLYPSLETKLYLIWKKSPNFSTIAEKFLNLITD